MFLVQHECFKFQTRQAKNTIFWSRGGLQAKLGPNNNSTTERHIYIYIYGNYGNIYIYTHIHTYIHTYIFVCLSREQRPSTLYQKVPLINNPYPCSSWIVFHIVSMDHVCCLTEMEVLQGGDLKAQTKWNRSRKWFSLVSCSFLERSSYGPNPDHALCPTPQSWGNMQRKSTHRG